MKLFRRIKIWLKSLIRKPAPTPIKPVVRDEPKEPVKAPTGREQRFPKDYVNKTVERYTQMKVGEGLIGRQNVGHIEWYKKRLLHGKDRYEKASRLVRVATGYDIPWQIIGVIHGMEGGFDFKKQILNGQPITRKTTWVPKGRGPWSSWEESCIDAFTWDDKYKIVPEVWGVAQTALFNERWNGMSYWNRGRPSPYIWGYSSIQKPGKYVSDGKYDHSAVTQQVGVLPQLEEIGFFDE